MTFQPGLNPKVRRVFYDVFMRFDPRDQWRQLSFGTGTLKAAKELIIRVRGENACYFQIRHNKIAIHEIYWNGTTFIKLKEKENVRSV